MENKGHQPDFCDQLTRATNFLDLDPSSPVAKTATSR